MTNENFGVFREETSVNLGDPYSKTGYELPRYRGKQFSAPGQVSGKLTTSFLQKDLNNTTAGDVYRDPGQLEKLVNSRPAGAPPGQKPFVPSSTPKKSAFPGATDGCIGDVYIDTSPPVRPATAPVDMKRKIYTSPQKKGGFGFPIQDRSIGGTKLDYVPDLFQPGREIEKELRKSARARIPKPFVGGGSLRLGWSDRELYCTPGPTYSPPPRPKAPLWRPSSPSKKGAAYCAMSKVGRDYVPDPIKEPEYRARARSATMPFRPAPGPKGRLSMWTVNKYVGAPRDPPDNDFNLD